MPARPQSRPRSWLRSTAGNEKPSIREEGRDGTAGAPLFSFVSLAFTAVSHAADAGNCRAPEEEVRAEGVYEGLECGDFCVITIKGKDRDYQAVADDEVRDILPAEGKKISLILRKKGFLRGGACAGPGLPLQPERKRMRGLMQTAGRMKPGIRRITAMADMAGLRTIPSAISQLITGILRAARGAQTGRAPQMPSSSGLTAAWSAGQSSESGSPRLRRSFPWTSWTRSRPAARRGRQCSARQGSRREAAPDPCLVHQSS